MMDLLSERTSEKGVLIDRGKWCPLCLRYTLTSVFIFSLMSFTLLIGRNYVKHILLFIEGQPVIFSTVIFICLFTTVSFPLMWGYILLNVAAGYLYSMLYGQLIVMISATCGTMISHFVIKKFFLDWVYEKVKSPNFTAFTRLVQGSQGFKMVILSRLTPIPFGLQNAVFALTNITWWKYVMASATGLFPTQLLNTYIGTTLRSMEDVLTDDTHATTGCIVFATQLIITILLTTYVARRAKQELDKTVEEYGTDVEEGNCLTDMHSTSDYNENVSKNRLPFSVNSNGLYLAYDCHQDKEGEVIT